MKSKILKVFEIQINNSIQTRKPYLILVKENNFPINRLHRSSISQTEMKSKNWSNAWTLSEMEKKVAE